MSNADLAAIEIRRACTAAGLEVLNELLVFSHIDSTNQHLLQHPEYPHATACLAETQSAGRGRRGKQWLSPHRGGLYLSLKVTWQGIVENTLSLAIGVALLRYLEQLGASELGIKWPNDILWRGRYKLAGLLLEAQPQFNSVIIGLGLNTHLPPDALSPAEQDWIDLQQILKMPLSRNLLAGEIIQCLLQSLKRFKSLGFESFAQDWERYDSLNGRNVRLQLEQQSIDGIARGISTEGELRLETATGIQLHRSGDVSVRMLAKN